MKNIQKISIFLGFRFIEKHTCKRNGHGQLKPKYIENMPSVKRTTGSFSTYQSYVTVVPRIIVHQCCSIPHSCNLVPIIPPGHNTSLVVCILSQPIVSFSEIIQDCPTPVTIRKFIYCIYRTYMYITKS